MKTEEKLSKLVDIIKFFAEGIVGSSDERIVHCAKQMIIEIELISKMEERASKPKETK